MDPLVSVIMPVYNGEPFFGASLDSALCQSYRNIEVIVVDDGSQDRTKAIAESRAAADPRVRVISQPNRGLAASRNRGLASAAGEFVAPLDADDIWDPAKIERQVRRALEAGARTGLVYCWWFWMDSEGGVLDSSPQWRIEGDTADALLHVNYIGNSSVPFFRRSHLEEIGGYDETLREGCEDWDVALKIAERAQVAVVPAPLVGYRWHRGNMSGKTDAMWRSHGRVIHGARRRRGGLSRASVRRSQDQFALYLAGVAFRSASYWQAVRWGMRSLRSAVAYEVLPHVVRLVAARAASPVQPSGRFIRPCVSFADWEMPRPAIPYDSIYHRRFRGPRAE